MAKALLIEANIHALSAGSFHEFVELLSDATLFAVITEEALRTEDMRPLHEWTSSQPPWSDLPFIVLTQRNAGPDRNPSAERLVKVLGNTTFLERPFHPTTFLSVAGTARAGRSRQYQARASIEALNESELRLTTALLAGHLGAWELDLASLTLAASEVCKAVFGRKPEDEFAYQSLLEAVHPDDRERTQGSIARTIETGTDCEIECRNRWPDGSIHWAEIRGRLVRDRDGRPVRIVGVSSDVTARKASEERLRAANDLLEQRVEERTRDLHEAHKRLVTEAEQRAKAEERLRQSQKLEALGQLTGGVAHDFNNLLMAILGNLELAKKRVEHDSKTVKLVRGAIEGAKRGAALTQRLLAFARQQELEVRPTDLTALVSGMLELLQRSVGSTISIVTDFEDDLAPVLGDANQIELALLNLAVNARDAMPEGGSLTISLRSHLCCQPTDELPEGSYVCMGVTDTGTGMDKETLRRAVDPFFSTKELGKGTGLGLSMIHGLALQLGGALKLASKVGEGTTAELWFPSATVAAADVAREFQEPLQRVDRPLSILIVDDDALIAMSTVGMLEDLGHVTIEANSPADALAVASSDAPIDLMITDYSMPQMNGAELAREVLQMRPGLPIVVATGYADLPPGAGIDLPRLSKPYSQQQLAAQISALLARSEKDKAMIN
ncbi:hybrid sensor histidine kinase/response regulator [Rhizobium sp. BK251]|uniref:hybrid sensor histidine kinase/response regulator n=1 Tax=Rhizobium sp. BK251 TaxID=2512125 RepID=UPI0010E520E7|nr:hybrid sensor histidine kinase/response regulator [Rhizobium sp. BK251]TCL66406.1 PAS domain S-box-containing protein [Rhizobium sp. BK251]